MTSGGCCRPGSAHGRSRHDQAGEHPAVAQGDRLRLIFLANHRAGVDQAGHQEVEIAAVGTGQIGPDRFALVEELVADSTVLFEDRLAARGLPLSPSGKQAANLGDALFLSGEPGAGSFPQSDSRRCAMRGSASWAMSWTLAGVSSRGAISRSCRLRRPKHAPSPAARPAVLTIRSRTTGAAARREPGGPCDRRRLETARARPTAASWIDWLRRPVDQRRAGPRYPRGGRAGLAARSSRFAGLTAWWRSPASLNARLDRLRDGPCERTGGSARFPARSRMTSRADQAKRRGQGGPAATVGRPCQDRGQ